MIQGISGPGRWGFFVTLFGDLGRYFEVLLVSQDAVVVFQLHVAIR